MPERVLIVDRDRAFIEKAEAALRRAGYSTDYACDAEDARESVEDSPPDILLCAGSLAASSGFDLIRELRRLHPNGMTCAVVLRHEDGHAWKATREAGADNYLVQPLRGPDIVSAVRALSRIRQLGLELGEARAGKGEPGEGIFEPFTGFFTFEHFKQLLFIELKRARRYGFPLSAALIAYDPLEAPPVVNKAELHAQLHGALAVAIKKALRDTDFPVAYKGGHVLVMMPHTVLSGACAVARRIQERVRKSSLRIAGATLRPSVSIGLASAQDLVGEEFADMIKAATSQLKLAMDRGGNRVMPDD